jgi:hypothetical protein
MLTPDGGYAQAGTSFEFSRLLTGEISVGYALRDSMTRSLRFRSTLRRDIFSSNIPGASTASTAVMLGVRLQN